MDMESLALDLSPIWDKIEEHKKILFYIVLILILVLAVYVRLIPAEAEQFPSLDAYRHYRHANEILDHGYPGTALKEVDGKMVEWDYMHDAPVGERVWKQFLPYFMAYSYKFPGQFLVSDLLAWARYIPVIFGVLAVLMMFLLVKELFWETAGLAAAFMYSLSPHFVARSVAGFADTDALIAFFTLLSFFLLIRAWDRKSFPYAIASGISLGMLGITWPHGYSIIPLLVLFTTFVYFVYNIGLTLYQTTLNTETVSGFAFYKKKTVFDTIKEDWKHYAIITIFLAIGILLVGLVVSPQFANIFKSFFNLLGITEIQHGAGVRNVFLTIAEFNPPTARELISGIHVAPVLFALFSPILLMFGFWDKLKESAHFEYHLLLVGVWLFGAFYASLTANRFISMLAAPLSIFTGIVIAYLWSLMELKKPFRTLVILLFLVFTIFMLPNIHATDPSQVDYSYLETGIVVAKSSTPILTQNWIDLFAWMRTETNPGDIMASWWDPGHAVAALGERPVVADGDQRDVHVHDLAIAFTTTDEKLAVETLKKYNVSYFFTSSDLIRKYWVISFLAASGPGGGGENYPIRFLDETKETTTGTLLSYPAGPNEIIKVTVSQTEITAVFKEGTQIKKIDRIYYFSNNTSYLKDEPENNTIDALLYLAPDYSLAIMLLPNLENNMLTRLHLFDGVGLNHFELVETFGNSALIQSDLSYRVLGNQIKVFRVTY